MKFRQSHRAGELLFLVLFSVAAVHAGGQEIVATRLNNGEPIISAAMFRDLGASPEDGQNINGPCAIRIPDWIEPANRADPTAIYYLYFAHHQGRYIRLAWASKVEGPWHLYHVGKDFSPGSRGVLDLGENRTIGLANGLSIQKHIASPDIVIDGARRRLIMYFHGQTYHRGESANQKTFVATSSDGLAFAVSSIPPVIIADFYFRALEFNGNLYGFCKEGAIFKARNPVAPWQPPAGFDFAGPLWVKRTDNPFGAVIKNAATTAEKLHLRHTALLRTEHTLYVFYTRVGDSPERVQASTIDLAAGDYDKWAPTFPPIEVLKARPGWEGGELVPAPSNDGAAPANVNQLRDPGILQDTDGSIYLFYSGRGEVGLGLARLTLPTQAAPPPRGTAK